MWGDEEQGGLETVKTDREAGRNSSFSGEMNSMCR